MAQPKSDAQWQAEGDADTLARAEMIKNTPARLGKAKTAAKRMAVEQEKQAKGMRKVAGRKSAGKPSKRRR